MIKTFTAGDPSNAFYKGLTSTFDTSEIFKMSPEQKNNKPSTENEISFWLHDQFHVLQNFSTPQKIKLIYSDQSPTQVKAVKRIRSQFSHIQVLPPVHYKGFEAGNFIASENYVLIGENTFYSNYDPASGISEPEYRKSFESELKTLFNTEHIIWAGFTPGLILPGKRSEQAWYQPVFHIDLFLTPAGKRGTKNLVFMGQIDKSLYQPGYLDKRREGIIDSLNVLIRQTANSLHEYYNEYHSWYPKDTTLHDFVFDTIPLAAEFGTSTGFYLITNYKSLNNTLVEIMKNEKNIYLSDFADSSYINVEAMKKKSEVKYSNAGFKVYFLQPSADELHNGALHCYTKVLWRSEE